MQRLGRGMNHRSFIAASRTKKPLRLSGTACVARTLLSANSQPKRRIRGYRKLASLGIGRMSHHADGATRGRRQPQSEYAYPIRIVCRDRHVGHLRVGKTQFMVRPGVCRFLRTRLCLCFSARRVALWSGRDHLVGRGPAPLVSRKAIKLPQSLCKPVERHD